MSLQHDQVGSQNLIRLHNVREPQLYLSHLTGRASVNLKKLSLVPLQMDSDDSIRDNLGLSYIVIILQA